MQHLYPSGAQAPRNHTHTEQTTMRIINFLVLSLALVSFTGCAEQAGEKKDDKKEEKKDGEEENKEEEKKE